MVLRDEFPGEVAWTHDTETKEILIRFAIRIMLSHV